MYFQGSNSATLLTEGQHLNERICSLAANVFLYEQTLIWESFVFQESTTGSHENYSHLKKNSKGVYSSILPDIRYSTVRYSELSQIWQEHSEVS